MAPAVRREQAQLTDTIFAVSSGRPPAAIAVLRISGPQAFATVAALAGSVPPARRASLRALRHQGMLLDTALVLTFPGPRSATGEQLAELHCHGGRAVVAAVEDALASMAGLRRAHPGEFTRRALANGRIDLMEAEGLADLLQAETEAQRIAAIAAAEGQLSKRTRAWLDRIADLSARAEALIDYADEDDVSADDAPVQAIAVDVARLRQDIEAALASPSVERLRDGVRVVIAGPPNAGKSTLLNLLAERDAAIVSPIAGTTRDRVEASVIQGGVPLLLVDTAGLTATSDVVEAIGVERAHAAIAGADILVWMGDDPPPRPDALWVHARADLRERQVMPRGPELAFSVNDSAALSRLRSELERRAAALLMTHEAAPAMREHQRRLCEEAASALSSGKDLLLVADGLAHARRRLAALLGLDATELMLDALFSRFCLGK